MCYPKLGLEGCLISHMSYVWDFSLLFCNSTFLYCIFLTTLLLLFLFASSSFAIIRVCFFLLLHPCCSHARGIQEGS